MSEICQKCGLMTVQSLLSKRGRNQLRVTKKTVESWHFNRDLSKTIDSGCLYSTLFVRNQKNFKRNYKFKDFFRHLGRFPDAECRKFFIYAICDTCKYERTCPKCKSKCKDVLDHFLKSCPNSKQVRLYLKTYYNFYGASSDLNFEDKTAVFTYAICGGNVFLKILYSFLEKVGHYSTN